MHILVVVAVIVFAVYKCTGGAYYTDEIFGPPDELPVSRYEDLQVGVYFTMPDGSDTRFLGETTGAASCGDIAYSHAQRLGLDRFSNWSYACCTHENGSECYRKIR